MSIEDYIFTSSGKPRALTNLQETEIGQRYLAGEGAPQLAKFYGCDNGTIYRSLKRQGIQSRGRSKRPRNDFVVNGYVWTPIDETNPIETAMQMKNGYRYLLKHRKVMALSLGRPLQTHEQVHHIDGNRANNNIDNLQLRQGQHGSGIVMVCNSCGSQDIIATKIGE